MPVAEAETYRYDVLDITKVWPHADYPPITIGRMVLDRNPENYFAEVEQSAFNPSNFVPGIGPSNDKMLQARLFSYHDTHTHRLGPNYHLLPVNAPRYAPERSYQRDGFMRVDANGGAGPNYWPNSFDGPAPDPDAADPGMPVSGETGRTPYAHANDDFEQAGVLYRDGDDRRRARPPRGQHRRPSLERAGAHPPAAVRHLLQDRRRVRRARGRGRRSRASPRSSGWRR